MTDKERIAILNDVRKASELAEDVCAGELVVSVKEVQSILYNHSLKSAITGEEK